MVNGGRFWIVGVVDCVIWIDNLFLKSLPRAVPDLGPLLADPARRLSEGPIAIGPRRKYAAAVFFGLLLAIPNWLWVGALFLSLLDPKKGPLAQRPDGPLLLALLLAALTGVLLAASLAVLWACRGGSVVLKREGVELQHRGSVVACPWSLFDVPGRPLRRSGGGVFLPVRREAVPLVTLSKRQ